MHHAHDHQFSDSDTLNNALAVEVARTLRAAIAARGSASLVVSGGRTPVVMFNRLSQQDLAWAQVSITLADERWVEADAVGSNEHLVRVELLRNKAVDAHFIGLKSAAHTAARGAAKTWSRLMGVPRPWDLVLLGMGDDGHTASLFPTSTAIATALDAALPPACIAMQAPVAPYDRLSLNLAALLETRRIVLHIQGAEKWRVYQKAQLAGDTVVLPICGILRQSAVPVEVYWSP